MDKKKVFYEARVFLLMLLVISSLRSALADWNDVPTGSMKPTIEEGDRVVVNKLAYDLKVPFTMIELLKWSDPKRENQLLVNGQAAVWKPVAQREDDEQGASFIVEETMGGKSHDVMFTPQIPATRSFGPLVVPAGRYFVMGDNRDNSNDSRFIGMIERRRIVGKAMAVAFSLDRNHWYRPRFHRFFKGIQ
jgi:signal peptidase I